jgi:hypothetical protein
VQEKNMMREEAAAPSLIYIKRGSSLIVYTLDWFELNEDNGTMKRHLNRVKQNKAKENECFGYKQTNGFRVMPENCWFDTK